MGAIETLAAIDGWTLLTFVGAAVILFVTPGPNMTFAVACGLSGGPRAGAAAGAGAATGLAVHVALTAGGASALLLASPAAYEALRWLGAAYLVWLAVASWRAGDDLERRLGRSDPWRAWRRGLLTCLLNPKAALFMLALLPQFADPSIGPLWPQLLLFGAIATLFGLLFDSAYGLFAGVVSSRLKPASRLLNRVGAVVFGGLAIRLAVD
ncbi:MAG: LysE family translocator [Pseudomonadota bacterium]